MNNYWYFIEADEDKSCWWRLEFPDGIDCEAVQANCLCVWPEIYENGVCKFSYGATSEYDGYYEFEYIGSRKTLIEAKEAAESLLAQFPKLV